MPSESDRVVGRILRGMREERGLTQNDLASRLQWPQSFVSKIEAGFRALKLSEVFGYAKALGIDVADLVLEVGNAL